MKNTKRILAGVTALSLTAALTACADKGENGDATTTTTTMAATTAKTVDINTGTLNEEDQAALEEVMDQTQDVELENKTVKWLAKYDLNPNEEQGMSKSVALEMFEQKYGGNIKWYQTTWENRQNDLSKYMLGGEGIDLFPGEDTANLPQGIISGMFQSVDDYIDINSPIWQNVAEAMDIYKFGGKHYEFVSSVTAEEVVLYNKATIDAQGFDDPWELYKSGEWNWDKFKEMLLDFVDVDAGQYGLDGYWSEKPLLLSAGVPMIGLSDDGYIQNNVNDATVEKAMNFQYELSQNNCKFIRGESFSWREQPQMLGTGEQLFYIIGAWGIRKDPDTWTIEVSPEDIGVAPVPSPAGSDPYQAATVEGYVLCKGAGNPQGAALFAECAVLGTFDERTVAISDKKILDECKWSEEILAQVKEIDELARKYPVVDLSAGCSKDIASLTTDGGDKMGVRSALDGTDWATMRDKISGPLDILVAEVNEKLKAAMAE